MKRGEGILHAVAGTMILLFAGVIYGWSVLSVPIAADFPNASGSRMSLTFTLSMAFFCAGGLTAGLMSAKLSLKIRMIMSALLFGIGFGITGTASGLGMLYLGYGVLCGTGAGFSYNTVMTVVPQYFPGRQGIISGVLLMGFGAGSLVIGSVYSMFLSLHAGSWRTAFWMLGGIMALLMFLGAVLLHMPAKTVQEEPDLQQENLRNEDCSPAVMLRSKSFWLFFFWEILISVVGLSIISQSKPLASGTRPDLSLGTIALLAGLISVCNGLGRILFGAVFDKTGWKVTMLWISITAAAAGGILTAALYTQSLPFLIISYLLTGIAYGGGPTMCTAFTKYFYGEKYFPVNFQIMLLNLLPASFSGTLAGYLYDKSGSYFSTVAVLLMCSVLAVFLVFLIQERQCRLTDI